MKYIYPAFLCVVFGVGVFLLTITNWSRSGGEAGTAYNVDEEGELSIADGTRPNGKTVLTKSDDGSDAEWLEKWLLTERSGKQLGSEELAGQPYVAGFFYSTCPAICVQQNTKVKELQGKFQGQAIRFVSISCDPEVDRPDVLQQYAERFEADDDQWLFFTGKMDYIKRVGAECFTLGIHRQGHPEKFVLVDKAGDPVGLYTWSDEEQWQTLQEDISKIIAAGGKFEEAESQAEIPADSKVNK
ncbi:MAG: SCO family protein [Planctomycetota bacterium]